MDIKIAKEYRILEDSLNFILLKKKKSNPNHHFSKGTPKESWKLAGYYGSVNYLVNTLMKCNIDETDKKLLKQLSLNVNEFKKELTSQLEPALNDVFSAVKIGIDYQITEDTFNLILSKRKESDPNHHFSKGVAKESWEVIGYYGKAEHLVHSLVERNIKDLDVTAIEQLLIEVENLKDKLTIELISNSVSNDM